MLGKIVYLGLFICCIVSWPKAKEYFDGSPPQLQIVSEVYKKQPYIMIPTAYLDSALLNKILILLQRFSYPDWQVQFTSLQGEWTEKLKCWPAANIEFYRNDFQNIRSGGLLLIYPRSYRGLIEDPLAKTPPPIIHIGSSRRLAFYYYPNIPKSQIHPKILQCVQHLSNSDLD